MKLRMFVDDIRIRVAGMNQADTAKGGANVMNALLGHLQASGCEVSEVKSVLMGSTATIRKETQMRLSNAGRNLKVTTHAKDLGCDSTLGSTRRTKVMKTRLKKARSRAVVIAKLVKQNKRAQGMVRPSVATTQAWGTGAMITSSQTLRRFRANMLLAIGLKTKEVCHMTAARLKWEPGADPMRAEPLKMVSRWCATLAKNKKLEGQVAKAWTRKKLKDLVAKKKTWAAVTGPTTGVVKTLTELDWDMQSPTTWCYQGKQVQRGVDQNKEGLFEIVASSLESKLWA